MSQKEDECLMVNVLTLRKRLTETDESLQSIEKVLQGDVSSEVSYCSSECSFSAGLTLEDLSGPHCIESTSTLLNNAKMSLRRSSGMSSDITTVSNAKSYVGPVAALRSAEQEAEQLGWKLKMVEEENFQLRSQNCSLRNDHDSLQSRINLLKVKLHHHDDPALSTQKVTVTELEEHILSLEAEVDAQERILRDTEDKLELSQRIVVEKERMLQKIKENCRKLENELLEKVKNGKRTEYQRNEALLNAEKLTVAFRQHKQKTAKQVRLVSCKCKAE
ncbi:cytoskeletal protein Sojo-like [Protopterus annectens]|uniref:cytoskeletal protein Sojo-like n=1 Tax=Protopterus annectens TaxID=7888 RepID=UPI001CFAD350|nr:cytoskeletal protein Sojo-like [Protopterus annectens]